MMQFLEDAGATERLGAALAATAPARAVVYLAGDLGAGKTTLARGFLRALGHAGSCRSPTYTLVEPYHVAGRQVYHFDLYRLGDPEELEFLGMRDYLAEPAICIIEWPQNGAGILPRPDLEICLQARDGGRQAQIRAFGDDGQAWLARLAR